LFHEELNLTSHGLVVKKKDGVSPRGPA